nr:MAG TPA: hypothetical protein [Caudoviricetes sp.]
MNKFQRKESRDIHRMITYYPIRYQMDAKYKIVRRNLRKAARILEKRNNQAHKKVIRGIDLANGSDQTAYIRQDLSNAICITKPIEVKNE